MDFCISAASGYANCLTSRFSPHRWRFDAPCRTLNQSRYSRSRRLWKGLGKPLQRLPYPAISENGCILSATGRTAPEVLATAPLLWQSTASHSVLYGYHILPGVHVSFLRVLWRQHILDALPFAICKLISFRSHTDSLHNRIRLCNIYFSYKA